MKNVKYISSFIMIFITFILIGEMFIWYLNDFETQYPYVTMYIPEETTEQQMLTDIDAAAKKRGVEVFVVDTRYESMTNVAKTIYGTDKVKAHLHSSNQIEIGRYNSIFLGKTQINFNSLENTPNLSEVNTYYLIGEKNSLVLFKQDLIDKYSGKFPQAGYDTENFNLYVILIWGIVTLFILLMTIYEIALMKKEVIIRIVSGERLTAYIMKNILKDFVFYIITIFLSGLMLAAVMNTKFYLNITLLFLTIILLGNSLLYLMLYFTNYKKDIQTKASAKKVVNISYAYKVVTIILSVFILSASIELINESIRFYKQKNFFEERKDYSYITLNTKDSIDSDVLFQTSSDLYLKFLADGKTQSFTNLDVEDRTQGTEYILTDAGSIGYLKECINEIQNEVFQRKIYFIVPEQYLQKHASKDTIKSVYDMYFYENSDENQMLEYEYEIITYKSNIEMIAISTMEKAKSTLEKNPVIILNNMTMENRDVNIYLTRAALVNISDAEWQEVIQNNDLRQQICHKSNIYEQYDYQWQSYKRNMIIGIVFLFLMMLLEVVIIKTILTYEYNINAVELSLKKVFGYRLFERNMRIILTTVISGFFGVLISILISNCTTLSLTLYVSLSSISIVLVELIYVILFIYKMEKISTQKLLKGGWL